MEGKRPWWIGRASNPVGGAGALPGGFDSHSLPPLTINVCEPSHLNAFGSAI